VATAVAQGATHVLVLQTRPYGQRLTGARRSDRFIRRYLGRYGSDLVTLHGGRPQRYAEALDLIDEKANDRSLNPAICPIRPSPDSPTVGQLEQARERLVAGAESGMRAVFEAWTGEHHFVREFLGALPMSRFDQWKAGAS
jgi:hypothetical protein